MVLWHSAPVPSPARPATIEQRIQSSTEPFETRTSHDNVAMGIASQVNETRVMASLPVTGSSYLRPASLGNQYPHQHVAPGIVDPTKSQEFYTLISSFHANHVHHPKDILVAHCTVALLLIIDIPQPSQDQELATETIPSSDRLMTASGHYKLAEDRETQLDQQHAVESRD